MVQRGGSAYYLRTASVMDVLDTAYRNGLELRLIPVDKNLDTSYNLDNQEGITMSNVPQIVFHRIVTDLQSEPTRQEPTFEIITEDVTYREQHVMVAGNRVNLGRVMISSVELYAEETDNLSKWIYTNLGT